MNEKEINLHAEIIRLKTELEDRELVLAELRKLVDAADSDLTEIFCNDVDGQNWFDRRAELRRLAGGEDGRI